MIGIGVIGYGYWGPNLVRNFAECRGAAVRMVCDQRPERLQQVERRYPGVRVTTDAVRADRRPVGRRRGDRHAGRSPLRAGDAGPARRQARAGREADGVVQRARRRGSSTKPRARRAVLMVDHTFVYTGAVRKMRELTEAGELGEIYYYDSVRINLGLFQHDVNVLWDLAVHDLSIMDYVLPQRPVAVSATGLAHVAGKPDNIAYMSMFFDSNLIAHVHVNWLSPVKVRRTLLGGSRRMVVFDDLEASEKVKVYDRGISLNPSPENVYQMLVGYRTGDMWAPQLAVTEALSVEAAHFVDCVTSGARPVTDGEAGLRVVRLLEAATESMRDRGRLVSPQGVVTS